MVERYFEKFPTAQYSNTTVVDITKRTVMLDKVYNNPFVFYPYEINSYERADQLSDNYYKDPFQSWIIYFANRITDPYYEWYLQEDEFLEFLSNKYGSYETSIQKVKNYRNDWVGKENIEVSFYNALPPDNKKYWEPVFGTNNKIVSYTRVKQDWVTSTNKIISYAVSNTSFTKDEIVNIVFDNSNSGKGQVAGYSNNYLYVQHLSGTYYTSNTVSITANSYIYGTESNVNTIFTSVSTISDNIPQSEEVYWKAVSYYEYEDERNQYNKTVRVLDKNFSQTISNNLRDLMQE